MKNLTIFCVIIFCTMVTLTAIAQTGGMNVGSLQANDSIHVGTATENVFILKNLIKLPPLTNSEILLIPDPIEGSIVYATVSDVLLVFDGVKWKRVDGQNDSYLFGNCCPGMPTITDIDGNTYNTVLIDTQCWMRENLKVTQYPNGDAIPYITDNTAWSILVSNNFDDAYCYYDNNTSSEYGALYTYAAAIADNWARDIADDQGICPDGWHLPTDGEWTVLTDFLGGEDIAGGKMKEKGTSHWTSPNIGATNESNFTALPGGHRYLDEGLFFAAGDGGYWWSATEGTTSNIVSIWCMFASHVYVNNSDNHKSIGFSVRCIRD